MRHRVTIVRFAATVASEHYKASLRNKERFKMAFSLTHSTGWDRRAEQDSFHKRLRARHDGTFDQLDKNDPDNLSSQQIRAVAELAQNESATAQLAADVNTTGTAFCKIHPEYLDTDANAKLIRHQLKTNGATSPSLEDFELAYTQLCESGFLLLNEKVLEQQTDGEAQRMADAFKNRVEPTEEDLEKMSKTELRQRAMGVWGK
jgi:hypothetical protein